MAASSRANGTTAVVKNHSRNELSLARATSSPASPKQMAMMTYATAVRGRLQQDAQRPHDRDDRADEQRGAEQEAHDVDDEAQQEPGRDEEHERGEDRATE